MDSSSSSSSSSSDIEGGCAAPDDDDAATARSYQYRHPPLPSSHGLRSQRPTPWPMGRFFFDSLDDGYDGEEPRHFLDSCFLCRKPLASNRDIFMYRGDLPFCSRECREEQIEMEQGKEKNRKKLTLKAAASARKLDANAGGGSVGAPSSSPKSHGKVRVRTSGAAVVAAG